MIAILQEDNTYLLDGEVVTLAQVMQFPYRVHLANGDIQIYETSTEITTQAPFDLLLYEAQVNSLHDELFKTMYQERKYQDLADIKSWADLEIAPNDPLYQRKFDYKQEATALLAWWIDTYLMIEDHLANVTEQTANAQQFISSLPAYL